jgi:protease IV
LLWGGILDQRKSHFYQGNQGSLHLNTLAIIIGGLIVIGLACILLASVLSITGHNNLLSSDPLAGGKDKIAVVYIDGQMVADGGSDNDGVACSSEIVKDLRKATDDKNVKAIVLRVNTPGGTPVAAEEIISQINKTRASKPVVVSMGDMATSAGYFVSSNADRIIANPDTFTGSIGVIWVFKNKSKYYGDEGVNYYVAKSGNFKDLGSDWRGLSNDEKDYVQRIINESYTRFVTSVAKGRNLSVDYVRSIADGRVYTGSDAKDMGLVDELGGLYDAVNVAANLSGLKGKPEIAYMDKKVEEKT